MPVWYRRLTFRKVAYSILSVYLVITCYTGFHLLTRRLQLRAEDQVLLDRIKILTESEDEPSWNPWGEEFDSEDGGLSMHHPAPALWAMERPLVKRSPLVSRDNLTALGEATRSARVASGEDLVVEVWSKAAIGLYLWEHILGEILETRMDGVWSYGETKLSNITFRFRTGPGVVVSKVPRTTQNLLLVLNGREPTKVATARQWLNHADSLTQLRHVGLVLLGNEACDNRWLRPYLRPHGGLLSFAFLVYDSPLVDGRTVFQWPLGVATYRDFPLVDSNELPLNQPRRYMFNFLGTVYRDSSRETLLAALNASAYMDKGVVKPRWEWQPLETNQTRSWFTQALAQSDLTLNPVGVNTECYRIYEAMAFGSVPVIEDVMTPGYCGGSPSAYKSDNHAPLRLLKEFHAPVIYVKNWRTDLEAVFHKESQMSNYDRAQRREHLVKWYEKFKSAMKERLVGVIWDKFFKHS